MRDPYNMTRVDNQQDGEVLRLQFDEIPEFDIEDYDLNDSKEFQKYIFNIEKVVRNSFEYRQLIRFLRENMDMNKCSFYENVSNIDTYKIKIELHHHPFSLYDITTIVYRKRVFFHEALDVEMVAKEVMYLHYLLFVGLIPLAETVHELVHNNYLFIPLDKVMGNFKQFEDEYGDFMDAEQQDKYSRNIQYTETFIEGQHKNILAKKYIYLDFTGEYELPALTEVLDMMDEKIRQIKNNEIEIVKPVDAPKKKLFTKL